MHMCCVHGIRDSVEKGTCLELTAVVVQVYVYICIV